ncbi:MAG: DNA polymerase III subunit delta' [Bacillota bacterium]|nr:DNA polymerase III subunit delta' [Bacillota bacterium]
MRFSEIIGNRDGAERLRNQIRIGRPFHAYIFEGPGGVGKRKLAFTFAQALLCRDPQEGEPCEKCNACKKAAGGNHADIHYIAPEGISIKDEVVEEVQEILYSKPFDGNKNILIIDKADTMTTKAQNRLLKIVEEPGESAVIIFLTEKISKMLPTIVSRSIAVKLKPADRKEIKEFLIRETGADEASAEIAASYSYGRPGKGVKLLRDEEFKSRREKSIECACGILEKKTLAEFQQLLGDSASDRESALEFLEMMSFWYRDLMLVSQGMDEQYIMNRDYMDRLEVFCKKTSLKKICRALEKLEEAKYDIIVHVNVNFVLTNMYLEIN